MTTKKLSVLLKGGIIVFGVCGILICVLWYPYSIGLTAKNSVEKWTQIAFYWLVSIPCFAVLWYAWKLADAVKKDEVFTKRVANLVKCSMQILFIDICVFLVGNIVFACLGWNELMFVYIGLGAIGLVETSVLLVIAHYIEQAAILREEMEGTI